MCSSRDRRKGCRKERPLSSSRCMRRRQPASKEVLGDLWFSTIWCNNWISATVRVLSERMREQPFCFVSYEIQCSYLSFDHGSLCLWNFSGQKTQEWKLLDGCTSNQDWLYTGQSSHGFCENNLGFKQNISRPFKVISKLSALLDSLLSFVLPILAVLSCPQNSNFPVSDFEGHFNSKRYPPWPYR